MNAPQTAGMADTKKDGGPVQGNRRQVESGRGKTIVSNNRLQARFCPQTLADLRRRLPDYLATQGLELRKLGNRQVARCPMHEDSRPSFTILPDGKTCGCYPCDWRGDVFAFAQWTGRATNFPDAVRHVAGALGVYLPEQSANAPQAARRAGKPIARPERKPEPPFILPDADRKTIHAARLRFSDALHAGQPIVADIAADLGLPTDALRWACFGECGLGLHKGALAYCYRQGMKLRRPAGSNPRFVWIVGKPTAPWRMSWALRPEVETVYLTEGESDTLALIAAGLEADGKGACVASPGTSFPEAWAPLFNGKRVVVCFDADQAGRTAAAKVAAILKPHALSVQSWKGGA